MKALYQGHESHAADPRRTPGQAVSRRAGDHRRGSGDRGEGASTDRSGRASPSPPGTGRRDDLISRRDLMRVVAGSARGTKLLVVPGHGTRPILDRVKTSLFDVLRPRLEGMKMLDLFAGSGSVGIEALS